MLEIPRYRCDSLIHGTEILRGQTLYVDVEKGWRKNYET